MWIIETNKNKNKTHYYYRIIKEWKSEVLINIKLLKGSITKTDMVPDAIRYFFFDELFLLIFLVIYILLFQVFWLKKKIPSQMHGNVNIPLKSFLHKLKVRNCRSAAINFISKSKFLRKSYLTSQTGTLLHFHLHHSPLHHLKRQFHLPLLHLLPPLHLRPWL